jgi:hypothetical protein
VALRQKRIAEMRSQESRGAGDQDARWSRCFSLARQSISTYYFHAATGACISSDASTVPAVHRTLASGFAWEQRASPLFVQSRADSRRPIRAIAALHLRIPSRHGCNGVTISVSVQVVPEDRSLCGSQFLLPHHAISRSLD